jgi:hypothetical protein
MGPPDLNQGGHMKKLVALVLIAMAVSPAFAKGNHTMAGCGLGYVLFGNSDNSRLMQILAATTNGTSGNQTLLFSSSTFSNIFHIAFSTFILFSKQSMFGNTVFFTFKF